MLSAQMGRASNTCSIKGIRGDLTTSLSASWPHIDQPVWDHSQTVWQLHLGPAHARTPSFTHAHKHTIYYRVAWIYSRKVLTCLSVWFKSAKQDSAKGGRKSFWGIESVSFIANCQALKTNGCLSFSFLVKPAEIKLLGSSLSPNLEYKLSGHLWDYDW